MITVATGSSIGPMIASGAELALMYAEKLLRSIPDEQFSHMPSTDPGTSVNSPAFNIGHLAIYPDTRVFSVLGRQDLAKPLPFAADLFKAGAPCLNAPDAYPSKSVLVSTFFDRHRAVIAAVAEAPDEVLAAENPMEGRMKELFKNVGGAVNFLLVGHTQTHLGQISVWRRVMGLGSAV